MSHANIKISKNLQSIAAALSSLLTEVAGEPMSFSLLVYPCEGSDRANYISNVEREPATKGLRDLLKHWESSAPDVPAHKIQ